MSEFTMSFTFKYFDLRNGTRYSRNDSVDAERVQSRNNVSEMVNLVCGLSSSIDSVIYDDYLVYIMNGIYIYKNVRKWIVSVVNLCLPDDRSDICAEQEQYNSNRNVTIIVVNVGGNLVVCDNVSCLVDGGTSADNFNDFAKASVESNINHVTNEVCEGRILSPMLEPTVNITSSSTLNYLSTTN